MARKYNVSQRAGETLEHLYRRLAKTADQRLVRLERLAEKPGFKPAKQWAYARAQRDIEKWSGAGSSRFNTKPPTNQMQLRAKINDIREFLLSPTSTKQGIVDTYKKRADTINERYGTDFTWDELADFFNDKKNEKMSQFGASKTVLRAIGRIQNAPDATQWQRISRQKKNQPTIIQDDVILDQTVKKLLRSKDFKFLTK